MAVAPLTAWILPGILFKFIYLILMTGVFYSVTRRKSTPRSTAPFLILAGNLLRLIIKAPTPDGESPRLTNHFGYYLPR